VDEVPRTYGLAAAALRLTQELLAQLSLAHFSKAFNRALLLVFTYCFLAHPVLSLNVVAVTAIALQITIANLLQCMSNEVSVVKK
jgi:hypothetical protein